MILYSKLELASTISKARKDGRHPSEVQFRNPKTRGGGCDEPGCDARNAFLSSR